MELGLEERRGRDVFARDGERLLRGVDAGHERAQGDQLGRYLAGRRRHVHDVLAADVGEPLPDHVGQPGRRLPGGEALLPGRAVLVGRPHGLDHQREAAVDDDRLAADHLRARRAEEGDGVGDIGGLDEPAGGSPGEASASICSRFGKWSSASVSTTPAETAFTRIPRGASSTPR